MKKFISEFKTFITRGNVLDLAIGVIIGGAFGKITTSLVNDVLMPFIGWLCGTRDMTALNLLVRPAEYNEAGEVVKEAITLGFGNFVGTIIDFLLVALVVFAIVKAANKAQSIFEKKKLEEEERKKKEEEAKKAAEPPKPTTEELLAKILEELKNK